MVRSTPFSILVVTAVALHHAVATSGHSERSFEGTQAHTGHGHGLRGYADVCSEISRVPSLRNSVVTPGDARYGQLIKHYVGSSSDTSACAVIPSTPTDVGEILKIVGRRKSPFAVKSGGHATNPGWSSTKGVHISLDGFKTLKYNNKTKEVEIGAGLRWEEVYAFLDQYGVSVAGGRVPGVGVGGFILGGGYAWKTNQYGLTIDTVTAFELVKPNGDVVKVTEKSDKDLFFGLKGSGNNFGIVTKFTLKAFPQGPVWGGVVTYAIPGTLDAVAIAVAKFSAEVKDPKAALIDNVSYFNGTNLASVMLFYDGPAPPPGIFDELLAIPSVAGGVVGGQSFLSFMNSMPSSDQPEMQGLRGYFLGLSVPEYSEKWLLMLNTVMAEKGAELLPKSLGFAGFAVEPFLPSVLEQNRSPTAYPWTREKLYTPFNIFLAWVDPSQDAAFEAAIREIRDTLEAALVAEGHSDVKTAPLYSNYALWDTPLERIYGSNLPRLRSLKRKVDPRDVMGLAGGFKIKP